MAAGQVGAQPGPVASFDTSRSSAAGGPGSGSGPQPSPRPRPRGVRWGTHEEAAGRTLPRLPPPHPPWLRVSFVQVPRRRAGPPRPGHGTSCCTRSVHLVSTASQVWKTPRRSTRVNLVDAAAQRLSSRPHRTAPTLVQAAMDAARSATISRLTWRSSKTLGSVTW